MRHNFHHYKAANITFTPYEISFKLCHFTLLERFPHMISKIFSRVRQIIICGQIKIFQVPSQVWSSWFTAQLNLVMGPKTIETVEQDIGVKNVVIL